MSDTDNTPSLHRRLLGLFVDAVIVFVVAVVVDVVLFQSDTTAVRGIAALLAFVLLGLQWGAWGKSVGMLVAGLRLTGPGGCPPGYGRAFTRSLTMLLTPGLGFVWWPMFLRRDQRGLHDLLAHTWVVRS